MKIFFFSNRFPHGDLPNVFRDLRAHSKSADHAILAQLLKETTVVVHEEISKLPANLRDQLPPFSSILDIAQDFDWHQGPLSATFECIFLCLVPLCLLVRNYEGRPQEFNFREETALFTGLGLGFLAATAIVASPSLLDVPKTAAEVIRIAMRTGLLLYDTSRDIEPHTADGPRESWATVVKGIDEQTLRAELDEFNLSTKAPKPSWLYISVVEPDNSAFITGPPSRLHKFFSQQGKVQSAPHAPLPVYGGPCHAAHLYNMTHSAWVTNQVPVDIANRNLASAARVLSMADGKAMKFDTAGSLFQSSTHILLTETIRWANVLRTLENFGAAREDVEISVAAFGPITSVDELISRLKASCSSTILVDDLTGSAENDHARSNTSHEQIAVVGMSCRLPGGANDLDKFWDLLMEGRDVHQKVPSNRYDVATHTDTTGKGVNTSHTPFGCFIDHPELFDATFFGMSPREARQTDPTHRLALLTAYEALEQSGYVPNRTRSTARDRVGTVYGQCSDDYREANAGQEIDMYFIPGNYRAFAPGRISYFFKFSGPSFNCDTACSSSLAAVQIACSLLSRGEADMVVAGGLNILTSSDSFAGLSRGFFLSKSGSCKVFDDGADGYCRGDGIGSIVLKRLRDAQRDNDNILGIILATATNHSSNAVSITHPHVATQETLYRQSLREAGIQARDVDLVEMHGTGTQAGDAAEIESVTKVFSPSHPRRAHRLHIASVKANLGHGEAAAGITALIKGLLIFKHNAIPKHVGIKTALNSKFPDLDRLNVHIPLETAAWPSSPDRKRYIMVNNFSAAGGNTCLLLGEPPGRSSLNICPKTSVVVTISAANAISLQQNCENLILHLKNTPSAHLPSLAYTTTARRMHHKYRIAVHGSSIQEIIQGLQQRLPSVQSIPPAHRPPQVAFVFSGQGSFYRGVSHELFKEFPPYRWEIERLNDICIQQNFGSIVPAITNSDPAQPEINPVLAQLASVCVQVALYRLWKSLGVSPNVVIGASLGEYAALCAAGALSASEMISLVGQRALLMEELCSRDTHAMLAVQATVSEIHQVAQSTSYIYEVSCLNAPRSITISGPLRDITGLQEALRARGYRSFMLKVPFAFHSSHVDPILDRYEDVTNSIAFHKLEVPVISPTLANTAFDVQGFPSSYLRDATRGPARFSESLAQAQRISLIDSSTVFIEIGIHPTYSGAVRANVPNVETVVPTLKSDESNWITLAASMSSLHAAGVSLDWNQWWLPFQSTVRLLDLPSYSWNLEKYWIEYRGDWLLRRDRATPSGPPKSSPLSTSLVHQIVEESFWNDGGMVEIQSDVMDPDFYAMASGHKMSRRPIVTVFAYTDIALTLADYAYSRIKPGSPVPAMDFGNVQILQGLIPRRDQTTHQWIRGRLRADLQRGIMEFSLQQLLEDGRPGDELATAVITCGDAQTWYDEWSDYSHLLTSRIAVFDGMVSRGEASRVSKDVAYTLFKSIVDYSDLYQAIQSVVLHKLEAVAEVVLAPSKSGQWRAPPHHIDPITHVGGLVLNAGHALDNENTMYVMEGWKSMRFAQPLVPGEVYQSYVKMEPVDGDSGLYAGDVHILRNGRIVGKVRGMTLRPLPRILMSHFFDPPDAVSQAEEPDGDRILSSSAQTAASSGSLPLGSKSTNCSSSTLPSSEADLPVVARSNPKDDSQLVADTMALIAAEVGIEVERLTDDLALGDIGVDSLLSLVLAEKFKVDLKVNVDSPFFLGSPTIGAIKAYLMAA